MEKRFSLLTKVLEKFEEAGVLKHVTLIGSWCLYFYDIHFHSPKAFPKIRTLDADFMIPNPPRIDSDINIPSILKDLGFVSTLDRSTGYVKFDHPDLTVEFLTPERGKGTVGTYNIRQFHVKAEGLRFLDLLQDYTMLINYKTIKIRVPQPAAFVLHKFLIGQRRKTDDKQSKDLQSAAGLAEFLISRPSEVKRLKAIYNDLPKSWKEEVDKVILKHCKPLSAILRSKS